MSKIKVGIIGQGKPSLKALYEEAMRIENDAGDPRSPKHISRKILIEANESEYCRGCGAEVWGGNGKCRYCGRTYGK